MCMKNLNATILTCVEAKVNTTRNNAFTYNDVFDIIIPKDMNGKLYVSEIDIIIEMTAILDESNKEDDGNRYIKEDTEYNCRLAVTFDGETFMGIGGFTFRADKSKLSKCGNRYFYNSSFLVDNQTFEIPENVAQCDLALLIKYPPNSDSGKWVLQTLKRLHINKPTQ